jgi:uncharacterized protein (DUF486 family)
MFIDIVVVVVINQEILLCDLLLDTPANNAGYKVAELLHISPF